MIVFGRHQELWRWLKGNNRLDYKTSHVQLNTTHSFTNLKTQHVRSPVPRVYQEIIYRPKYQLSDSSIHSTNKKHTSAQPWTFRSRSSSCRPTSRWGKNPHLTSTIMLWFIDRRPWLASFWKQFHNNNRRCSLGFSLRNWQILSDKYRSCCTFDASAIFSQTTCIQQWPHTPAKYT